MTDNEPRITGATDPDSQELVHPTALVELFRAPVEALANLATAQQEELKAVASRLAEIEAALSKRDDTVLDQMEERVSREVEFQLDKMASRLSEIEAALSRLDDTMRDQIAVEVSREVESELEDLDISTQVQDHLNEIITEAVAAELLDIDWSDHIAISNA